MLRILVHLINNKLEKVTLKTNQPAVIITRNAFLCIQFPETKWKKNVHLLKILSCNKESLIDLFILLMESLWFYD